MRKGRINNNGNNRYLCIGFFDSHYRSYIFQDTGPQRTKGPQSLIIGRYLTEQDRCNCLSFLVLTDEIVEGVTLVHQDTKKAPAEICKCLTAIYKKTLQISCSVGVL